MISRECASRFHDWLVAASIGLAASACSTTTVVTGHGSSGAGGSSGGSGGSSQGGAAPGGAGGGAAGTSGGANGGAPAITIAGVHGRAFDLGGGRVRIEYDFSTPDQAQDFNPSTGATLNESLGQLDVANPQGMAIALFFKRLHADHVAFSTTLLQGSTTNWYINTVWDGGWNPASGYGAFHDQTGRVLLVNGTQYPTSDVTPVAIGKQYHVVVDQTDSLLSWALDGVVATEAVAPLPVTDRSVGLGGWNSTVAIDDVVIEGTLAP